MKTLILLSLLWCRVAFADPPLPGCIHDESSLKTWVEKTIHDAPPAGGTIEMLKHWPPKYAKNDHWPGGIWIVPAFIKVTIDDGTFDHEMAFLAFHCDTRKTSIEILFGVKEEAVHKYLDDSPPTDPDPKYHAI